MDPGWWLVLVSVVLALAAVILRTRVPAGMELVLLVAAGAGMGSGGMLLQPDPSVVEFVAAVAALSVLVPGHVRIVLGPFGPSGRGLRWRASASTEELGARRPR